MAATTDGPGLLDRLKMAIRAAQDEYPNADRMFEELAAVLEPVFVCEDCGEETPWSKGAADDKPDLCDDCWAKFHDQPMAVCPGCGKDVPDNDGFGVLVHTKPEDEDGCGYCEHPSLDGCLCTCCKRLVGVGVTESVHGFVVYDDNSVILGYMKGQKGPMTHDVDMKELDPPVEIEIGLTDELIP